MTLTLPGILVDPSWLYPALGHAELLVLDATVELPAPRFDGDYRAASGEAGWRAAHIPGSRHADLLGALADGSADYSFALPAVPQLIAALAELGVGAGRTIVLYDRADGFWAARLWWMLRSLGIETAVLDGGFAAWHKAGLPLASGQAARLPIRLPKVCERPELWIDRHGVQAIVEGRAPGLLVCALSAAVFNGTAASRYARRGHIPGSVNLPARRLFDAHGRYLPPAALAEVVGEALLRDRQPLVLYCGGGISAAADALALTLLGRDDLAIYDGSLQEWAADAALPMTAGTAPL